MIPPPQPNPLTNFPPPRKRTKTKTKIKIQPIMCEQILQYDCGHLARKKVPCVHPSRPRHSSVFPCFNPPTSPDTSAHASTRLERCHRLCPACRDAGMEGQVYQNGRHAGRHQAPPRNNNNNIIISPGAPHPASSARRASVVHQEPRASSGHVDPAAAARHMAEASTSRGRHARVSSRIPSAPAAAGYPARHHSYQTGQRSSARASDRARQQQQQQQPSNVARRPSSQPPSERLRGREPPPYPLSSRPLQTSRVSHEAPHRRAESRERRRAPGERSSDLFRSSGGPVESWPLPRDGIRGSANPQQQQQPLSPPPSRYPPIAQHNRGNSGSGRGSVGRCDSSSQGRAASAASAASAAAVAVGRCSSDHLDSTLHRLGQDIRNLTIAKKQSDESLVCLTSKQIEGAGRKRK